MRYFPLQEHNPVCFNVACALMRQRAFFFSCEVFSQFQAVARVEHTVRDPMQSLPGGEPVPRHPRRVERAALESSLSESLASSCPAALALSGVLQRLQHVEEKFNQVTASSSISFLLCRSVLSRAQSHCQSHPKVGLFPL